MAGSRVPKTKVARAVMNYLQRQNLDPDKAVVGAGAAMRMQGLRPDVNDIDLFHPDLPGMVKDEQDGFEIDAGPAKDLPPETLRTVRSHGVNVQSPEALLSFYRHLNRPKDQPRIQMLSQMTKEGSRLLLARAQGKLARHHFGKKALENPDAASQARKGVLGDQLLAVATGRDLDQALLELQSAEEEQSILKLKLAELIERRNRHNIFLPQGWIVTERNVEVNENVQPGAPLGRVSDYRELVVPLYVSSGELSSIQSLPRTFNAGLEGETVTVSINWINPEFNEKTRKLHIELILINYSGSKRGGLKLTLPLNVNTDGLYIPKAAVSTRYENPVITLKHTEQVIQLLILGDGGNYLLAAEDKRLSPGMELKPAQSAQQSRDK